jgi:uncharacterized protein (TIGR03437 family)
VINASNKGAGDPYVFAYEKPGLATILLVARQPGLGSAGPPATGNNITLASSLNSGSQIVLSTSGATLSGGGSAGQMAPGTIFFVNGTNLSDTSAAAPTDATQLPFELAGVELYVDGMRTPLFSVSPTQIKAVMPWSVYGASTASSWLRITRTDGSVTVTNAVNIPIVSSNPGIFADPTPGAPEPRTATALHGSSYATASIQVGGTTQAGDTGVITIGSNSYSYTVSPNDTLVSIEISLINLINANPAELVTASPANEGYTIRLQAKVPGPVGNGISVATSTSTLITNTSGVLLSLTATNTATCCASIAGTLITPANPAVPGETIIIYATGMGLITPDSARITLIGRDGNPYNGPAANAPVDAVSSSGATGGTVLSASLQVGYIGLYQVVIELPTGVPSDARAQLTISQGFHTSNVVTIPVGVSPPLP